MMEQDNVVWMRVGLEGARVMIVGGGRVAARKATKFVRAGARVTLIAPELCEALAAHHDAQILWKAAPFEESLLEGASFVVAATDDPQVNARVAAWCAAASVPVNVADASAPSTFHLPAVKRVKGVEFSTFLHGASPALTVRLMARLEALFEREERWWVEACRVLGTRRPAWMKARAHRGDRRAMWRALTGEVLDRLEQGASPEELEPLFCGVTSDEDLG